MKRVLVLGVTIGGLFMAPAALAATSTLTVQSNYVTSRVVPGATSTLIASFSLNNTGGTVILNSVSLMGGSGASVVQNVSVRVQGVQFGATQSTISSSTIYTFVGSSTIPGMASSGTASTSLASINVYADVLSSAPSGMYQPIAYLTGCLGIDAVSSTLIPCPGTFAVGGYVQVVNLPSTLSVSLDNSLSPPPRQLPMDGITPQTLGAWRFTEATNYENVKVTDLQVFDQVAAASVKSAFNGLQLFKNTDLTTPLAASAGAIPSSYSPGYFYNFHFTNPVVVPQAGSITLVLKGIVDSYASSGATDNTSHVFKIPLATSTVALGSTSNLPASIFLGSTATNPTTVLRSKLSVATSPLGLTTGRTVSSTDDLGLITVSANSAGPVLLNQLKVTFAGSAASSTSFLGGVWLLDANGVNVENSLIVSSTNSTSCIGYSSCSKTWYFLNGFPLAAGTSYTFKLRIDSTKIAPAQQGIAHTLTASILNPSDVVFKDSTDSAASQVSLDASLLPLSINSVTYASGTGGGGGNTTSTAPTITSVTPNSGPVGTQVTLTGSDFSTQYLNSICFPISTGGCYNAYASTTIATSLTFILPSYISPGTYAISVGGSNSLLFTVLPRAVPLSISIISPQGGEAWTVGSSHWIIWGSNTSSSLPVQIGIRDTRYDPNLGNGEQTIANTSNSGSYLWTIPSNIGPMTLGAGNVYKVVLYLNGGGSSSTSALSSSTFSILFFAPVINSVTPNSGPLGTQVKIAGSGFTSSTDVAFVGSLAASSSIEGERHVIVNAPISSTLQFTIPPTLVQYQGSGVNTVNVVPGSYYLILQTAGGKSSPAHFTVTSSSVTDFVLTELAADPLGIRMTVCNYGAPTTRTLRTWVTANNITRGISFPRKDFASGQCATKVRGYYLWRMKASTYTVTDTLDPRNLIPELTKENNFLSTTITLSGSNALPQPQNTTVPPDVTRANALNQLSNILESLRAFLLSQ